jgi:hypothetical protein
MAFYLGLMEERVSQGKMTEKALRKLKAKIALYQFLEHT